MLQADGGVPGPIWMRRGLPRLFAAVVAVTLALVALPPSPVHAIQTSYTFTVDTVNDTVDANPGNGTCADSGGKCSLRAAVMEASALQAANPGAGIATTINLPAGTYTLTLSGAAKTTAATDLETYGSLNPWANVTIIGSNGTSSADPTQTIIQAGAAAYAGIDSVLAVNNLSPPAGRANAPYNLTLKALWIRNGNNTSNFSTNGYGGAVAFDSYGNGQLLIDNCIISDSQAANADGGGLALFNGSVANGPGSFVIQNSIIRNNKSTRSSGEGGGIFVGSPGGLTLTGSLVTGNSASQGGGIEVIGNNGDPGVTISNSAITGNTATNSNGGGLNTSRGITVTNATISGNSSSGASFADGGGVYVATGSGMNASFTNVTIAGNTANGSIGNGGGLAAESNTANTLTLTNVTIAGNTAGSSTGGGLYVKSPQVAKLQNTLIASNTGGDIGGSVDATSGYNLIGTGGSGGLTGTNGNQVNVASPGIGSLANNGGAALGPTGNSFTLQTVALLHGSPALDAGSNGLVPGGVSTDERGAGYLRIADSADADTIATVDIGAYEAYPDIEVISAQAMTGSTTKTVTFNVGDASLGIDAGSATSSNQTLVPNGSLSLSGTGGTRTLSITPAAGQGGTANITVTVSKSPGPLAGQTASTTFPLTVYPANGSGTMTVSPATVSGGQTGVPLTFTFTAPSGGISGGEVDLDVPSGWTAPSTSNVQINGVAASAGNISGSTIKATGVTLAGGGTLTITYTGTAPVPSGAAALTSTFTAKEASLTGEVPVAMASSPAVSVYAPDGSGTMTVSPTGAAGNQSAALTFTYTVANGGMTGGEVDVTVPAGWTAPSTANVTINGSAATAGNISGTTIKVPAQTLAAGATLTIGYTGTAPAPGTASSFSSSSATVAGHTMVALAASPSVTAYAANGSGTMAITTGPTTVSGGQAGIAYTFTYTATTGGMSGGEVDLAIPSGWAGPSTSNVLINGSAATAGNISGSTIKATSVTLAAGATMTIQYTGTAPAPAAAPPQVSSFTTAQASVTGATPASLASSPSVTIYAPDGSGTMVQTGGPTTVYGGVSATLTFTYTAANGGMSGGEVDMAVPAGWTVPDTTNVLINGSAATAGNISGSTIKLTGLNLTAGQTQTIQYTGTPPVAGTPVTATFATSQYALTGHTLAALGASPSVTVQPPDGTGTMTAAPTSVSGGQTPTLTFTYTAATDMTGGEVDLTVPANWTAPSTSNVLINGSAATAGNISGSTIKATGINLTAGSTLTITYTGTAPTPSGAAAISSTFAASQAGFSGHTPLALASSPSVSVYAPDGSGTLAVAPVALSAGQTANLTLTYTAANGGTSGGEVDVTVPAGWSGGTVSATGATATLSGSTIKVTGVTLTGGAAMPITLSGVTVQNAPAASVGFAFTERSTATGTAAPGSGAPSVGVYAADGSGTLTVAPAALSAGQTANLTFTYTAATGGTSGGEVGIAVPAGWSGGSVSATGATATLTGGTIKVTGITLAGGAALPITLSGVTVQSTPAASVGFAFTERSTAAGTAAPGSGAPSVSVYAADGTGSLTVAPAALSAGQTADVTFTYAAAAGGTSGGEVDIAVPAGWSGGSVSATGATATLTGGTIKVTGITLAGAAALPITLSGVTVQSTPAAGVGFAFTERSTATGTLTAGSGTPTLSVYAADGSGALSVAPAALSAGQTANLTLTYTAAAGGTSGGEVGIALPAGWSGGTASATGATATRTGSTIKVTGLTLAGGAALPITLSGVTVQSTPATGVGFAFTERSTAAGTAAAGSGAPTLSVYAADGSGTLTVTPTAFAAGQTANLAFTYTAAAGGTSGGEVDIAVPAGWSGGSVSATGAAGTLAGGTIKVTGVTLAGGAALPITLSGVTVPSTPAASVTFAFTEQSTTAGTGAPGSGAPSVSVYAADGSGALAITTGPTNVSGGQSSIAYTFTYTAATGGTSAGEVDVTVPAGWTAPGTGNVKIGGAPATAANISANTIKATGVTLAGGGQLTIEYTGTAPSPASAAAITSSFATSAATVSGHTPVALATSPAVTVYAPDGSGSMAITSGPSKVSGGQSGITYLFTYTAANGGMNAGEVDLTIPGGWSAPSTTNVKINGSAATAANISGSAIKAPGLALAAGQTLTIEYTGTAPVPAALASGSATFATASAAVAGHTLQPLASSPSVTVYAPDGSGLAAAVPPAAIGGTRATFDFVYTAWGGGMDAGTVQLTIPAAWPAPATGGTTGVVTASAGTLSVAGQTVTVSGLTLPAGGLLKITYAGVLVPGPVGPVAFAMLQQSTPAGHLTDLAVSPVVLVVPTRVTELHISGPLQVSAGQTATYLASGAFNNGTDETVNATWSASGGSFAGNVWTAPAQAGMYTLTASYGGTSANVAVTVVPGPAASLKLAPTTAQVKQGEKVSFTATVADSFGNQLMGAPLTWSASGGSLSGSVWTAPSQAGTYTVIATTGALSASATITVTAPVVPPGGGGGGGGNHNCPPSNNCEVDPHSALGCLTVVGLTGVQIVLSDVAAPAGATVVDRPQVVQTTGSVTVRCTLAAPLTPTPQLLFYTYDAGLHAWLAVPTLAKDGGVQAVVPGGVPVALLVHSVAQAPDTAQHWANEFVLKLQSLGVISGYPDGSYHPDEPLTRAQLAKLLAATLHLNLPSADPPELQRLLDRDRIPAWARPYVAAVFSAGLMIGDDQGFHPGDQVTRAQMAVILGRLLPDSTGVAPLTFTDSDTIPDWARSAVARAVAAGLISGFEDNTFRPAAPVTRAQVAKLLWLAIEARAR